MWRHAQDFGGFLEAQPAEVAQLDAAALAGVETGERTKRFVEGQHLDPVCLRHEHEIVERNMRCGAAALGKAPPARVIAT